jgi:septum site-determining protein MinD
MARTIGVIAIKGGVGKTTTVASLGAVLAQHYSQKVLLVDANFSAANLGLHLGVVNPEVTLHDVLADKFHIEDAIHHHELGFDVIPASLVPKKVDPLKLKNKLKLLNSKYDVILIDSSPALNEEILSTMLAADELMVVTSPDYPTLSCTMHAVKVAKRRGTPITGLILNKVRYKNFELKVDDIEAATETPVIAVFPDDTKVLEALANTTPTPHHAPNRNVAVEYKKLAASLLGKEFVDTRWQAKLKHLLRLDLPKHEVNRMLMGKNKE